MNAKMLKHHIAEYNGKAVVIDYVVNRKREFSVACMRVRDNISVGATGIVITPKGERFLISRETKLAVPIITPACAA
ncbi:MAG TPA: hypothetical protein VH413_16005 [Verrucomicrobiae bacterium]|jgi:hypothetical protein|nr:hypothetical protein [Verrucomicrobiae bacterium]